MIGAERVARGSDFDRLLDVLGERGRLYQRRGVYLLKEVTPVKVLKPLKVGARQAFLIGEMLSRNENCPILPRTFRPESGKPYLWHKGSRYMLTEFLEGREADYYRIEDLQAAIKAMNGFHRFGKELIQQDAKRWSTLRIDLVKAWQTRLSQMEICREMAIRESSAWAKQYLKLWHHHGTQAHQAIHELQHWPKTEPDTLCYHDWAFHNVIIQKDGARLFDFDYMLVDQPVHDKCNLIGRYLRLFQWSRESLFKILWNFDRFYSWHAGELGLLRILLTFPYDFWILGRQFFLEKQPWSMKYFQEQWSRKISGFAEKQRLLELFDKIM